MTVYIVFSNYWGHVTLEGVFGLPEDAEAKVAELDADEVMSKCLNYIREYEVE